MRIKSSIGGTLFSAGIALLVAAMPTGAIASGMTSTIDYSTTATIGSTGVDGPQVLSYQGVANGTLTTDGTPFDLGRFVVSPLSGDSTTNYNTTFQITLNIKDIDGVAPTHPLSTGISGHLDGTTNGVDASKLQFAIPVLIGSENGPDLSATASFRVGNTIDYLNLTKRPSQTPSPSAGTIAFYGALVSVEVVPEPGSLAIFGVGGLALYAGRRCRQ